MGAFKNKSIEIIVVFSLITFMSEFYGKSVLCQSATDTGWIRKDDAPRGLVSPSSQPQILGGKFYFINGDGYILNRMMIFDPGSGKWESRPTSLITNRHHFATAVYDGKLFVAGGCTGNDSTTHKRIGLVKVYDPEKNSWKSKSSMCIPRQAFQLAAHGHKLYAIGGTDLDSIPIREIEVYDPAEDKWTIQDIAPWKSSTACWGAVVFDQKIYIMGQNGEGTVFTIFNPSNNTFVSKLPANMDRNGYATAIAADKIFIIGGALENPLSIVAVYDISGDVWTKYPDLPEARAYPGALQYNNSIYCIGGIGPAWDWDNPAKSVFQYMLKMP